MTRKHRILAFFPLLVRLGFVLALVFMQNIPHPGMIAVAETPEVILHHVDDSKSRISHSGAIHDRTNDAFCDMVCAATDKVEGQGQLARFEQFAVARWTMDADRVWAPYKPDIALRPPDTTPDA